MHAGRSRNGSHADVGAACLAGARVVVAAGGRRARCTSCWRTGRAGCRAAVRRDERAPATRGAASASCAVAFTAAAFLYRPFARRPVARRFVGRRRAGRSSAATERPAAGRALRSVPPVSRRSFTELYGRYWYCCVSARAGNRRRASGPHRDAGRAAVAGHGRCAVVRAGRVSVLCRSGGGRACPPCHARRCVYPRRAWRGACSEPRARRRVERRLDTRAFLRGPGCIRTHAPAPG